MATEQGAQPGGPGDFVFYLHRDRSAYPPLSIGSIAAAWRVWDMGANVALTESHLQTQAAFE